MNLKALLLLVVVMLGIAPPLRANDAQKAEISKALAAVKTPRDSLPLLYDLYDLASIKEAADLGWVIYGTATRAGNDEARMDMLRRLSVSYVRNDSVLTRLEKLAAALPESSEAKGTRLFIKMQHVTNNATYLPEEKRQETIKRLLADEAKAKGGDIFSQVERLYTLCIFLGTQTHGDMYQEYMAKLKTLIDRLPPEVYSLRNQYYTSAAIAYALHNEPEKSLEADRELLRIIKALEEKYKKEGRKYRNYDVNYYICYRRMMSNYSALSDEEMDSLYAKVLALVEANADIAKDFEANPRPKIYMMMKEKRYAEAIPLIEAQLDKTTDIPQRIRMLGLLKEAAVATDNQQALNRYMKQYNDILEEYVRQGGSDKLHELQLKYDVDALRLRNAELENERLDGVVTSKERVMIISLLVSAVLICAFLVLYSAFIHARRRAAESEDHVKRLRELLHDEVANHKPAEQEITPAGEEVSIPE